MNEPIDTAQIRASAEAEFGAFATSGWRATAVEMANEIDSLRAAVQRVEALLDHWADCDPVHSATTSAEIRAALAEPTVLATAVIPPNTLKVGDRIRAALSAGAGVSGPAATPAEPVERCGPACSEMHTFTASCVQRATATPTESGLPWCSDGSGRRCDPDCMFPCHTPKQMAHIRATGEVHCSPGCHCLPADVSGVSGQDQPHEYRHEVRSINGEMIVQCSHMQGYRKCGRSSGDPIHQGAGG